ncbi:MAG: phosphoribosylglycinamide formyltransferase [Verrucomicrobiota bacterium]|nr:phosphoribosylglycinamide formyltransferase [Verrucomicrobiota bacterium]
MVKIGILGSGTGSNCRAILQSIRDGRLRAEAKVVISDVFDAGILDVAREFGVANAYLMPGEFKTRLEPVRESELVKMLREAGIEVVVLAGFMRVLKEPMLAAFEKRIVNIHPSLLPKFPGLEAWRQALEAGERKTGVTVHFVDAQIDHGEIIAQREVAIETADTADSLHARMQEVEHALYPEALARVCEKIRAA